LFCIKNQSFYFLKTGLAARINNSKIIMKTTIEISIECKGQAVGTLGWFNSMMSDASFVIKESKDGRPAMFLKAKNSAGTGWAYSFLCKKATGYDEPYNYNLTSDGFACEIPESDGNVSGFSDYPLTPACRKAVKEMINKATDAFREWWNEN
jgi:hypothetical protein